MENPQSRQVLARHGKSFYWASFFLSNEVLNKCSSLYNFCRTLDDIVDDDNKLEVKKKNFYKFKKEFENNDPDNQIIKDMWSIINSENISKKIVIDLFDGVETDLEEKVQSSINIDGELQVISLIKGEALVELGNISRKGALYKFQGTQAESSKKIYHISKRSDNSIRIKPIPLILSSLIPFETTY